MANSLGGLWRATETATVDYPVVVRKACKFYSSEKTGQTSVLFNLNMTVAKGTIYALLGPSGCGKTTLLRCIIGRLTVDRGYILTLGQIPGSPHSGISAPRIGYMPQEDALDGVMSIKELFNYYGLIMGLDKKEVERKTTFLVDFLKLPSTNSGFRTLSGGQKRRVSFAIALIHDAELLILDEPTVGVDPILKHSIWDYLLELVQSRKTTVIITTHYIEEARESNTVGMMFDGRVLAEDAPRKLMTHYGVETLEDVFFHICIAGTMTHAVVSPDVECFEKERAKHSKHSESCSQRTCTDSKVMITEVVITNHRGPLSVMDYEEVTRPPVLNIFNLFAESYSEMKLKRLQAIIYRGLIQFIRFPGLLVLLMASPAFQIALCGFSLGRSVHSVPLGVFNSDAGPLGGKFLSCISDGIIVQINYSTWELARESAHNGETWGAIMFGHNFSAFIVERFNNTPHVGQETLLGSCINVSLDGSNFLFVETIRFTLLHAFERFVNEVIYEFNLEQTLAKVPLLRDDPVFGKFEDPFSVFIMPSFITGSAFFTQMGLSIIVLFLDKAGGKLERIYVAGVAPIEVICGFLVLQMVILMAEVILMVIMALVLFQFTNNGSIVLLVALCVLQGLCGSLIGIFVSASSKTFPDSSGTSMTILLSSIAFGGYFWPLEATSPAMRLICMMLPFGTSANAMRAIMHRGWDLTHFTVQLAFGVTLIWIVGLLFASVIVFRMKNAAGNRTPNVYNF